MRKIFVAASLSVVALGSWAFYPKATAAPEYMQLSMYESSGRPILVVISPRGEVTEERMTTNTRGNYKYQALLLVKLNELRAQGWTVAQMQQTETRNPDPEHPMLSPNVVTTAIYLLERK